MKINEIITEGNWGAAVTSIARGIGTGLAAGIGFDSANPVGRYQPTNHLSNADQIAKNAVGKNTVITDLGVSVTKASNGRWYDTNKEIITTPEEIAKLDQQLADKNKEQMNWNADSGILNISGSKYKRINNTDWEDVQTGDTLKNPADINAKFDIASGRVNPLAKPIAKPIDTTTPNARFVAWHAEQDKRERAAHNQQMAQQQIAQQPTKKPQTGGKVPGQVSQTPNAQRKRAARQPQVFSSNRPK